MAKQKRSADPDLLSRLWSEMTLAGRLIFDRRVGGVVKLIPVLTALYILSPIDLIPDVFLPFGVLDDMTAFFLGLQLFIHAAPPGVVQSYRERRGQGRETKSFSPPPDAHVINGEYSVRDDD